MTGLQSPCGSNISPLMINYGPHAARAAALRLPCTIDGNGKRRWCGCDLSGGRVKRGHCGVAARTVGFTHREDSNCSNMMVITDVIYEKSVWVYPQQFSCCFVASQIHWIKDSERKEEGLKLCLCPCVMLLQGAIKLKAWMFILFISGFYLIYHKLRSKGFCCDLSHSVKQCFTIGSRRAVVDIHFLCPLQKRSRQNVI